MTIERIPTEQSFKPCPGCGNLIPANATDCQYCGYRSSETIAAQQEAERERHFFYALFNRSNPFTMIFIGINLAVFVLMWMAGGMSTVGADDQVLVAFGAKVNQLIDERHQYWRLVTSVFIHIGYLHIFFNMYALYIIGQEIERLYGSSRFVIVYLLCGIAGSYASYYFNPRAVSAGASGAIFGLFGVMATFAFRYRKELPGKLASEIKRRILPVIIINLAIGFSIKIVDNAAHIGGLLTGVALCFLIPYKRPHETKDASIWRALMLVCLLVIAASFVSAFINYNGPKPQLANLTAKPNSRIISYVESMSEAHQALIKSVNSFERILKSKDAGDTTTALNTLDRGIAVLNRAPKVDERADQYRTQFLDLMTDYKAVIERYAQSGQKDRINAANDHSALMKNYAAFLAEYRPWLTKFLEERGLRLQQPDDNQS